MFELKFFRGTFYTMAFPYFIQQIFNLCTVEFKVELFYQFIYLFCIDFQTFFVVLHAYQKLFPAHKEISITLCLFTFQHVVSHI